MFVLYYINYTPVALSILMYGLKGSLFYLKIAFQSQGIKLD
jgi:hypothetical protein